MVPCLFLQLQQIKSEIAEVSSNPQGLLLEALHSAGYSGALAKPLMASESAVNRLDVRILEEFVAVRANDLFPKLICSDGGISLTIFLMMIKCRKITLLPGWFLQHQELSMTSWFQLWNHFYQTFPMLNVLKSQNQCMWVETIGAKQIPR